MTERNDDALHAEIARAEAERFERARQVRAQWHARIQAILAKAAAGLDRHACAQFAAEVAADTERHDRYWRDEETLCHLTSPLGRTPTETRAAAEEFLRLHKGFAALGADEPPKEDA
jgi:hypothetical protein